MASTSHAVERMQRSRPSGEPNPGPCYSSCLPLMVPSCSWPLLQQMCTWTSLKSILPTSCIHSQEGLLSPHFPSPLWGRGRPFPGGTPQPLTLAGADLGLSQGPPGTPPTSVQEAGWAMGSKGGCPVCGLIPGAQTCPPPGLWLLPVLKTLKSPSLWSPSPSCRRGQGSALLCGHLQAVCDVLGCEGLVAAVS